MTLPRQTHHSGLCKHAWPPLCLRTGSVGTLVPPLLVLSLLGQVSMTASCQMFGAIAKCNFKSLTKVPMLPSYTQHLYLEQNRISVLDSESLRGLPLLERLDLGNQSVRLVIRNNTFQRQQKLKALILGSNRRLRLETSAFAGLNNLQELYLDYCDLTDSILSGSYLQPLSSLKKLDLTFNKIVKLKPASFFSSLRNFTDLNLKLNQIDRLCEEDLIGFQGLGFTRFNISSNKFNSMSSPDFDWEQCGNPFKNMTFRTLDLSSNGFNATALRLFFKAIDGTPIVLLHNSGALGRGFSFENLPDPDKDTFKGLRNSHVRVFDLASNYIFALQDAVFSPLTNARFVNVSSNKINQIHPGAFRGLQNNLLLLNLSFNLLGEIYGHTFDHLTNLRVLDLSYNHIGILGYQAFRRLPSLEQLDLRGNSLRKLGSTASLPSLLFLHLSDNRLSSLWGINQLAGQGITYLAVEDNRLTFLDDIFAIVQLFPHLNTLLFGGNFIKWCASPSSFESGSNSLTVLDLPDSSLQIIWAQGWCLDIFQHFGKLLGLNLTRNSLTSLPQGIFSDLHSIIEIDLSFNDLTYLQSDIFPHSLLRLDLSNNFLATPNPATFQHLAFINLAGNRFYCDCNLESFLWWLNNTNVTFLTSVENLRCEFPSHFQYLPLRNYSTIIEPCEEDDEKTLQALRLALFILSTVLVVVTMLGALVYARLRGHIFIIYKKVFRRVIEGPKPPPPEENIQYDAFVCYSEADYNWVEKALLKKLDSGFSEENLFRCCFEARDFLPGVDHLDNIRDAIWGSRKTICVVSSKFLKDGWCLEAFTLAQGRKLEELSNVLIMIVVGRVAHYQLMRHNVIRAFVQTRQYLVWPEDPQDMDWFYDRLMAQIIKEKEVKKKKKEEEVKEDRGQPAEDNAIPMVIIQPQV